MHKKHTRAIVTGSNLSVVWAKAFLNAVKPKKELTPLVVMLDGLEDGAQWEDAIIRSLLDEALGRMQKQSCNTVANTIFPESLWNPGANRTKLYERYKRILPAIRKCPKNKYGIYFERLIAYCPNDDGESPDKSNQLEHIIRTYSSRDGFRRTVLQASLFDPMRDHTSRPYLHFPCLQHITFTPLGDGRGMSINAFYAMQYLFERAYGNYLGLCRLGRFVAHELGLELAQMNCTVGIGELDVETGVVDDLISDLQSRLYELGDDIGDNEHA